MTTNRECLDVETLAAWMDGALDRPAVAAAEAHVSDCERCQALVATMSRTLPELESIRLKPDTTAVRGFGVWRWWLAPLAAGAAAVTLWVVVPQTGNREPGTGSRELVAETSESPAARDMARVAEAPAPAPEPQRQDAAPAAAAKPAAPEATVAAAPAVPLPASPAPPPAAAPAALASRERAEADVERNIVEEKREAAAKIDVEIIATAHVGPAIAWQVGRQGLVRLTTDGATFTRVPFPEAVDLVAVTATSASAATVTTRDGRRFDTRDGGKTWQPAQ